jgi:hypothetical protein
MKIEEENAEDFPDELLFELQKAVDEELVREEEISIEGGAIPIALWRWIWDDQSSSYFVTVEGVEWFTAPALHHAVILFEIMKDHLTDYMHYEKV